MENIESSLVLNINSNYHSYKNNQNCLVENENKRKVAGNNPSEGTNINESSNSYIQKGSRNKSKRNKQN